MLKNTSNSYGVIAKAFHWTIALLIVGMIIVGITMSEMAPSPLKGTLFSLHKSTGVLILGLVILRLSWRLYNPAPKLPENLTPWHRRLAKLSPYALYTFLFLMPLSGFVLSQTGGHQITFYNLFTLPMVLPNNPVISKMADNIHVYGAFILIGVLILHIGAALYHHVILKNSILKRMLPNWLARKLGR